MWIQKLILSNFRSYRKKEFVFSPQTSLILGANASGKTNILEAIFLLATGGSRRARYDKDVIRKGELYARIEGLVMLEEEEKKLEVFLETDTRFENLARKKVKLNNVNKTHIDFIGNLITVMFEPEDIGLVISHPKNRRSYIDTIFTQIDREYRRSLSNYNKVIRQRNKLLENINETSQGWDQLEFWNKELLSSARIIHEKRQQFFDYCNKSLPKLGKVLDDGGDGLKIEYKKSFLDKRRQQEYQAREVAAKVTLIGPHRDDFTLIWKGYDLAEFGSRGEQRTAILALKLSELEFISEKVRERPVLLLDDIFSELDHKHRSQVFKVLGKQQTIITATDIHLIAQEFLGDIKVIDLNTLD